MATTTATLTLSSGDLTGDALALSSTTTLTKGGTTTGLDQTTGVARKTTGATTAFVLFEAGDYTAANPGHKVYIKNTMSTGTEYFTVSIGDGPSTTVVELGRLYAGDFMFIPWSAGAAVDANHNDIVVAPSSATDMTIESALIYHQD